MRTALVTGSSRGLGAAITRRLADDGLAVAVNTLHDPSADQVVQGIRAGGGTAELFVAAVTDDAHPSASP